MPDSTYAKVERLTMKTLATTNAFFVLQEADAMRHPYEQALAPLGVQVTWLDNFDALLNSVSRMDPAVVVVDLDTLPHPVEPQLEQLRALFSESELVALSSTDSSQLALHCVRAGFSEFLLKPASPEELAHSLRKSLQKRDLISRIEDPKTSLLRAITQISGATTPALVMVHTLQFLSKHLGACGGAWVRPDTQKKDSLRILASVPGQIQASELQGQTLTGKKKTVIPIPNSDGDFLHFWGLEKKVSQKDTEKLSVLLEHSQLTLHGLQRFEQVKQQTFLDDLTGLFNSRYLKYALAGAVQKYKQPGQGFSVLFIDVDHFKQINDKHSHLVGSEFLVTIAKTIKNAVRKIDPVFRYGGDEFVVILNDSAIDGAMEIAERIRKNIERRVFVIQEARIQTTVSIGLACFPQHAKDSDTLLRMADEAMYSAKRQSRNSVHLAISPPSKPPEKERTV